MKRLTLSILISTGIVGTSFSVPLIDLKAGLGYTALSPSGSVKYKGNSVDVKNDLNLGSSKNVDAYLQIGLPVLPTIKLEYLPTNYKGDGKASKKFTFGNYSFTATERIKSKIKMNQYDLSLFYSLPVPVITPRLGVAVKYLDGYVDVSTSTLKKHTRAKINTPIPMVYAGINLSVPALPLEFDVEGKAIAYKGNSLMDIKGMGTFTFVGIPLIGKAYVGVGYRYQRLKLDKVKDLYSDIKFKGFFGEVGVSF